MSRHTPGTWRGAEINGHHAVIGPFGVIVAFCGRVEEEPEWVATTLADVNLIKEAPNMAVLLAQALPIIDAHRKASGGEGDVTAAAIRHVLEMAGKVQS